MRLENVGRRYGLRGPWVLREVGLALPAGTLVRITGTNGTGKSTLLRLIAGIDAPTRGRITGRPARTTYVPERFPAALPFTAGGYLVHLGRIQGLGGAEAAARAGEWLERFGAAAFADTPLAELSKGSSQKVAVAQALMADPPLLVLDEAWTGLDTDARGELDRAVRDRVGAGGTVVFVDHDPRRLAGEADAVFTVAAGRVRPGSPERTTAREDVAPEDVARVRIVASGGPALPGGIPGSPAYEEGDALTVTATVDADHSDTLLRALLDAGWHIDHLSTEGVRV
ncbi:ATP-binding cassette domain-containing protein [Streptomyces sp. ISL-36]|uniref:ABC transporter ATP-binding protein n=1 Tax=Streptomyces sp. ISL-36 TaxID=2819182 RepID=UPI001BE60398|nr:ATP-binding cassette domain-containing protein [Streptomyces sp. ISL-36]MBT2445161.1 ATP-binding cassette domain-containing protein [Streptomyces sp. ISL-36]